MSKLAQLMVLCRHSIVLYINNHRDGYQTPAEYIQDISKINGRYDTLTEQESDLLTQMTLTDTVVELTFYPTSAIGSFTVLHYDVDEAIELAIKIAMNYNENAENKMGE